MHPVRPDQARLPGPLPGEVGRSEITTSDSRAAVCRRSHRRRARAKGDGTLQAQGAWTRAGGAVACNRYLKHKSRCRAARAAAARQDRLQRRGHRPCGAAARRRDPLAQRRAAAAPDRGAQGSPAVRGRPHACAGRLSVDDRLHGGQLRMARAHGRGRCPSPEGSRDEPRGPAHPARGRHRRRRIYPFISARQPAQPPSGERAIVRAHR